MARTFPQKKTTHAPFAFFFLILYSVAVLVRPHEAFEVSRYWTVIMYLAIFCFLGILATLRPLTISIQEKLLLGLVPVIMLSAFANGYGMKGITQSQAMLVGSIVPLFLYSSLLTSIKRHHIIMFVCLIAAMFMVHNGHVQRASFDGYGWTNTRFVGDGRITYMGFFQDPNDIGLFLVMCIPFTVYFMHNSGYAIKTLFFTMLCAILYGVYLTDSRGTFLGVAGLAGIYLLFTKGGGRVIVFSLITAPMFATLIAARGGMSSSDSSANGRLEAWYSGLHEMFLHNPLLGVGKGNFVDFHGRTAHNSFVHVVAELGFLGYTLWGGTLFVTVLLGYNIVKYRKKLLLKSKESEDIEEQSDQQKLILAELKLSSTLFFSLVAFMITGFFLSRGYVLVLFIFLGLNIAAQRRLISLVPDIYGSTIGPFITKSLIAPWVMIVLVYITLKIT